MLQEADPATKSAAASGLLALPIDISVVIDEPAGLPGRLEHPVLVDPRDVPRRSMANKHGRAGLIHALAHIECNAINLSLDACWRFAGMPEQYYRDWLKVAAEEAYHFTLLSDHLKTLGYAYGDFPAHNGLWDMVRKTKGDVLARMALVPRTLEARGLDASPPMRAKLAQAETMRLQRSSTSFCAMRLATSQLAIIGIAGCAGSASSITDQPMHHLPSSMARHQAAAEIVEIILRDEIGHVAIGNHWYRWLCEQQQLNHRFHLRLACNRVRRVKAA